MRTLLSRAKTLTFGFLGSDGLVVESMMVFQKSVEAESQGQMQSQGGFRCSELLLLRLNEDDDEATVV